MLLGINREWLGDFDFDDTADTGRLHSVLKALFMYFDDSRTVRNDHTKVTIPHPVRSAKSSTFGLS